MMGIHGRATPRSDRKKARILDALKAGPMTAQQVADKLHMSYQSAWDYLEKLRDAPRQVFISSYGLSGSRPVATFELGDAPDAVYVPLKLRPKIKNCRRPEVLLALEVPLSNNMLAHVMEITNRQSASYLRELKSAGKVYIHHWKRTAGNQIPFYAAGEGKADAPRPEAYTPKQYRERRKAKSVRWAAALGM